MNLDYQFRKNPRVSLDLSIRHRSRRALAVCGRSRGDGFTSLFTLFNRGGGGVLFSDPITHNSKWRTRTCLC